MTKLAIALAAWWILGGATAAQDPPPAKSGSPFDSPEVERFKQLLATGGLDRRPRAAPDEFLPSGNRRTSDAGAVRVYKKGPDGKPLKPQPDGYPHTIDPAKFKPSDDELLRLHEGFDLSSRDAKGNKVMQDLKAGVYGRVVAVGTGNSMGKITVEVDDRKNRVEYLHTSKTYVKIGDEVTPQTVLGMTGKTGTKEIHLHVQARNAKDQAVNPDEVVLYARKPPKDRKSAEFFIPFEWEKLTPASADVLKPEPVPLP